MFASAVSWATIASLATAAGTLVLAVAISRQPVRGVARLGSLNKRSKNNADPSWPPLA